MTANAGDTVEAFNNLTNALSPGAGVGTSMIDAINKLTDALATFAAANTGNQTIALTGDVTGSGTGTFAVTLGSNKVTAAKIDPVALKLAAFGGRNLAGACTLTNTKVGDIVLGVVCSDGTDGTALFEAVITVADQIQQVSATDLSTKKYGILLLKKGA
jgi:hypothetical protein